MENAPKKKLMEHPAYVAGELAALRCLILALLEASGTDHTVFVQRALDRLADERLAFQRTTMPEAYDKALETEEKLIRTRLVQ